MITAIIFSSILFLASLICVIYRLVAAPCCAFLGLLVISMAHTPEGYPLLPISNSIILGWLFVSLLVTVLTFFQPAPLRRVKKGMGYYLGGAFTGMAIGLLGFSFISSPGAKYAFMIVMVALATLWGAMMYARTPNGQNVAPGSGNFFTYLLAKGFPAAITVMQLGTVLVILNL